jgi:uncharacterized protein involved in exopolysaccharide biosynthesis
MAGLMIFAPLMLAAAAANTAPPLPAAPVAPAVDVESLQQRLLASQQVIATLERQLAEEHNRAAALDVARMRNGNLVSIARQLIDAYEKRYGMMKHHDPLQLGRRRFEFELQALSEAVYDMKAEVPLRSLPGGAAVAPPQASGVTDKKPAEAVKKP